MKLTDALKKYLQEKCGVVADASDEEYRKAAGEAIANGTLSAEKLAELSIEPEVEKANEFTQKLDSLTNLVAKLAEIAVAKEAAPQPKVEEKQAPAAPKESTEWQEGVKAVLTTEETEKAAGSQIRVKGAWESYDGTKQTKTFPETNHKGHRHAKAGQRLHWLESGDMDISEREKAVAGAWAKHQIAKSQRNGSASMAFSMLNDHDKELLRYGAEKMEWGGSSNGIYFGQKHLTPSEQKALIDDGGASGGLEAAPIVFDAMVIERPLLFGELFPLVNVVPIERGRRVEGVSQLVVTGSWGGVDDTAVSLFNTASYIAAFDTTIFRWQGAIHVGLDFLSDTPIDFASRIARQYGDRLKEDLDDVIADGNGTTQPEGIMQKSGATSVNFGGSTSLSNYESLRFGVSKPEHQGGYGSTAVFCGNETSYQRARALAVGSSDARRLFGMDYDSYSIMQRPYKINESLANTEAFYAILGRYRMYQRKGIQLMQETSGDTLRRQNELLILAFARYGGQAESGAIIARSTTLPA